VPVGLLYLPQTDPRVLLQEEAGRKHPRLDAPKKTKNAQANSAKENHQKETPEGETNKK